MSYIEAVRRWGIKGTMMHLFAFKQIKIGDLVGKDELGNTYYENYELPSGQNRWVQHAVLDSQQLADATVVPPEWFIWLHQMTDTPPGQDTTKTGYQVAEGSAAPNTHHYNLAHTRKWRPNQTLVRERGYGLGTYYSKVGENAFYTQPGHIMNPTYKADKSNKDTVFLTPEFLISIEDQYGPEKMAAVIEKDWRTFAEKRKQMNLAATK